MSMAHAVEGRYPFLDYRLVEFCNHLPPNFKLRGLSEKYILKRLASKWIPAEISRRPKRPYRAPTQSCFFPADESVPEYVNEMLSPAQLNSTGYFNPTAVSHLVRKVRQGARLGETDNMALVGILSTQLTHQLFVTNFPSPEMLSKAENVKIIKGHTQV